MCKNKFIFAYLVPLSGRINTELRTLDLPIISGLDIHLQLFRNKDEFLIMCKDKQKKFRLNLEYFECYLQRQELVGQVLIITI